MKLTECISVLNEIVQNKCFIPPCIWGEAGIGKTSSIINWCEENNYNYKLTPVAQIQEVGDLLGLPVIKDGITTYAKSEFIPDDEDNEIYIWILDDINRANNLILQSMLNIFQFRKIGNRKLGKNTFIILTANPETDDYQVKDMDIAMKTRLLHLYAEFDSDEWSRWAISQNIKQEYILFINKYPEIVNTNDNNIRSWTNGFMSNSDAILKVSVGDLCYYQYEKFIDNYSFIKDFNIDDIYDNQNNIIKLFKNNSDRSDIKLLLLNRISLIDINLIINNDNKLEKIKELLIHLNDNNYITNDELLMVVFIWKNKFQNKLFENIQFYSFITSQISGK